MEELIASVRSDSSENESLLIEIDLIDVPLKTSLINQQKEKLKIIVFDLGGGTYDVSLIYVYQGQIYETKGYEGDQNLGGCNFDNVLMEYSLDLFCNNSNYNKDIIKKNYKCIQRLKRACGETKKYLSIKENEKIYIEDFYNSKPLICQITRAKFEELSKDLYLRLSKPLDNILQSNKLNIKDIDQIILVGGSSKMPKIKKIIENKFENIPINDKISPDEAVAFGACILAECLRREDQDIWKDFIFEDKIRHSIGIEVENGLIDVILTKGKRYPTSSKVNLNKLHWFHTMYDNQYTFDIKVYERESKYACDNNLIIYIRRNT